MASFDRLERCVLSRAHTPRFLTLVMFPCRQTNVSVQSTAIVVGDCTPIVHADCKISKAHSSISRNSSSPIPGRLVVKSKYQTPVSAPDKRTRPYDSRTRLCDKFRKSELEPTQKIDFLGYHFDLIQGKVFPTEKKLKILEKSVQDMEIASQTTPRLLMSLIGVLASLEKTIPMGRLHMRPFQWYLKTNWQYPQSLDLKISVSNLLKKHLQWWKDPKYKNGLSFTSIGTQYPYFHRCVKLGLRSSVRKHDSGNWTDQEKLLHINVLELKAVFLALKKLSKQNSRQKGSDSNRQCHCSQLSEQTRGNTLLGHVSPGLAHLGLLQSSKHTLKSQTHSGLPQCHSRHSLQEGQIIQREWSLHSQIFSLVWQSLAQTNGGHVCHQIESQTTNLCLTSPRCKCYEHRCIEYLLGGSGRLCLFVL